MGATTANHNTCTKIHVASCNKPKRDVEKHNKIKTTSVDTKTIQNWIHGNWKKGHQKQNNKCCRKKREIKLINELAAICFLKSSVGLGSTKLGSHNHKINIEHKCNMIREDWKETDNVTVHSFVNSK